MPIWVPSQSVAPGEHLPPLEACPILVARKNGKVAVRYTVDTPIDGLGIPDGPKIIEYVNSVVDPEYEYPGETNVHHLCYPRRAYEADPVSREFREGAGLMVRMQIQPHNLLHKLFNDCSMPKHDVMVERNREQRSANRLFELGRTAIRYGKWAQQFQVAAEIAKSNYRDPQALAIFYRKLSEVYENRYQDFLEKMSPGPGATGLLPDPTELVDIQAATKRLGRLAGAGYIDAHRAIHERNDIRLAA